MIPEQLINSAMRWVECTVKSGGVNHFCLFLERENQRKLNVCALDLQPQECIGFFWEQITFAKCSAIVMGLDRYANPNQGTEFDDLYTLFCWWDDPKLKYHESVKVGVINYQKEPLIVRPIDWDNAYWNPIMLRELKQHCPRSAVRVRYASDVLHRHDEDFQWN